MFLNYNYGSDNFVNQEWSLNSRFLENADFAWANYGIRLYLLSWKLMSPLIQLEFTPSLSLKSQNRLYPYSSIPDWILS